MPIARGLAWPASRKVLLLVIASVHALHRIAHLPVKEGILRERQGAIGQALGARVAAIAAEDKDLLKCNPAAAHRG